MTRNCFALAIVLGVMFSVVDDSSQAAGQGFFTPRSLRSVPIVDRPDRPGHFIGNSIRRRYNQTTVAPTPVRSPRQRYVAPVYAPTTQSYQPSVAQPIYRQPVVVNRPIVTQPSYVQSPPTTSYSQPVIQQQPIVQPQPVPQLMQSRPVTQSDAPALYYSPLGGSVLSN